MSILTSSLAPALEVAATAQQSADCAEHATQTAMTSCAGHDYASVDAELHKVCRELRAVTNRVDESANDGDRPGHWITLLEAQRAWLAYRDAHCRLAGNNARGGSLEPMLVSACKAELTRARTQRMRALLTNQLSGETRAGTER